MAALGSRHSFDLLLLTWAAATLDALAYLHANVFTANMTGNTVLLGIDLLRRRHEREFQAALAISAFSLGAFLAGLVLVRYRHSLRWDMDMKFGLALELPFVIAFSVLAMLAPLPSRRATVALIVTGACGLGIQSAAVRRLRISGVVTTFMTGTITTAMMQLLSPRDNGDEERHSALLLAMLACYILAAGTAAVLDTTNRVVASASAPAAVAVVWIRSLKGE